MKNVLLVLGFVLAPAIHAMADEWSGYISDSPCTKKMSASRTGSVAHADCAKSCIKGGATAVLVTNDGKIYQIANLDKVIDYAGQKVTVEGDLNQETIKVTRVRP